MPVRFRHRTLSWRRRAAALLAALATLTASPAFAYGTCAHHVAAPAALVPAGDEDHAAHAHHGTAARATSPEVPAEHHPGAPCTCLDECCPTAAVALRAAPSSGPPPAAAGPAAGPTARAQPRSDAGADHRLPPATAPPSFR